MIGTPLAQAVEAPGKGYNWGMASPHPVLPRGTRVKVGGIRAGDLVDLEALQVTLDRALGHHNAIFAHVYCEAPISFEATATEVSNAVAMGTNNGASISNALWVANSPRATAARNRCWLID